jgi:hypothetical protein
MTQIVHGQTLGHKKSPEYNIWAGAKSRCFNKRTERYHLYGGRGITMCERWRSSFLNFLADMGPRPSPRHELDRWPNNDGNYEPGNCRWATRSEQMRNTSINHYVVARGERLTITEWAERVGIPSQRLWARINDGWDIERALTEPVREQPGIERQIEFQGVSRTLAGWAKATGIPRPTLHRRFRRGWDIEKTLTTPCLSPHEASMAAVRAREAHR